MNSELNIEEMLRRAPRPTPPAGLLTDLERQIQPPFPEPGQSSAWKALLRRFWVPTIGLAGAFAAIIIVAVAWHLSTTRTVAESVQALARVKSFRVIERVRSGPGKPVIKDKTKRSVEWPNYHTSMHPGNPFAETQHWFQADPATPFQGKTHSVSERQESWRSGNLVLKVDRQTGEREVRLDSSRTIFAGIAAPIIANANIRISEATGLDHITPELAARFWVGEVRYKFNDAEHITRIWIDRQSHLVVRVQQLGTEWPEVESEVLLQEWEFIEFDTDFPPQTFELEVTEEDLAPLGITKEELAKLSTTAFSMHLTGDAGAEVEGFVADDSGRRAVRGKLPLAFVHTRVGNLSYEFLMVDRKARSFGLSVNNSNMSTVAAGIVGKLTDSESSMESAPFK
ncbi:MAG: anti-sigma factor [Pedosphaera sp.]|nr:anti-sigma factor [Pedosphaera sp.]